MKSNGQAAPNHIMITIVKRRESNIASDVCNFFLQEFVGGINMNPPPAVLALIELLHTATLVHDMSSMMQINRRGFFSVNALKDK